MKRWALVVLGAGAYALALIAMAPASLLDARISDVTAGKLRLVEAQGTVWRGTGIVEARDVKLRPVISKAIAWRVAPSALLRGAIEADAFSADSSKPASIVATLSRIEIASVQLNLPAAALGVIAPKLAPLQPTGNLELRIERLAIEANDLSGSGVVRWQPAGSAMSSVFPLGAYELRLDAAGAERRATLRTLAGPLQLEGGGSWSAGSRPRLKAAAEVPPAQRESLSPLLRLIARDRGDGRFDLDLQ